MSLKLMSTWTMLIRRLKGNLGVLNKKYPNFNRLRNLFGTYLESFFKYCSPTWIFYSRNTNNKINKSHDRAPRLIYHENISTFKELLEKGQ